MGQYTAGTVIQLPRLQASGAMTLGKQLLAAAKPHKKALSKGVAKALGNLDEKHGVLCEAIRDQVAPQPRDSAEAVRCDRVVDGCWSGLNDFFTAFTKLTDVAEAAEAAELQAAIFGKAGLKFILLPY